jgi:sigma-E factor negative regulatory protein RseB
VNARTGALLLAVTLVGGLGVTAVSASAALDRFGGAGDDDPRAVALLHRAAVAMRTTAYSGTRMLSAWGRHRATTLLVDVDHVPGQGSRLSLRGGGLPEDAATFLVSGAGAAHTAAGLGPGSFGVLTGSYAVTLGRGDSVAGRPSTVVEVSRGGRTAARLWVDDRSGLLLRREVFDSHGRLVGESTFIDVRVPADGFLAHLPPTAPEPPADALGRHGRHVLEARGWDCPRRAGAMRLVGIEALDRAGAMHLTYTDGLSRLSVFEQRGSLDPGSVRGFARMRLGGQLLHVREGIPTYAVWQEDGLVFTAVTDGTVESLAGVVASEPARPDPRPGFWGRVAGGMARLGRWASPLL